MKKVFIVKQQTARLGLVSPLLHLTKINECEWPCIMDAFSCIASNPTVVASNTFNAEKYKYTNSCG